jgi:bis(5'-nucleosyl)-tetraphosphatase (symmetrical)
MATADGDGGASTYAIGDVHGCTRTLRRLIELLPLDRDRDRLWLVGDLVGPGPDSAGTLRCLRELEEEIGPRLAAVLGNHDLRLVAARAGARVPRKVKALLDQVLGAPDGRALLDWLGRRPLLHEDRGTVLVHAGLLPWWTVEEARERASEVASILASARRDALLTAIYGRDGKRGSETSPDGFERALQTARVMTTIRTLEADGTLCEHNGTLEGAPAGCRAWFAYPDRAQGDATIVFGHWAALGLRFGADWLALDSGCAWGGPLTAVRVEDRRVFQTPRID